MPFDSLPENNTSIPQVVLDLMAARQYLDTWGWCKGVLINGDQRCAVGAIRQVTGTLDSSERPLSSPRQIEAENAMLETIMQSYKTARSRPHSIPQWNDAVRRTKDQVLAMFDKTIERVMGKVKV